MSHEEAHSKGNFIFRLDHQFNVWLRHRLPWLHRSGIWFLREVAEADARLPIALALIGVIVLIVTFFL